jgi:hypothetical protein
MSDTSDIHADARDFIAENASHAAYWADIAREAATIRDDTLLAYATRKAAAYARAFVGAVREMLLASGKEAA